MAEPDMPQQTPCKVEVEAGDYWWCACGKSSEQPFCDGSHNGTKFEPVKFTISEKTTVWLCGCKRTQDPPFCDGSHKHIYVLST